MEGGGGGACGGRSSGCEAGMVAGSGGLGESWGWGVEGVGFDEGRERFCWERIGGKVGMGALAALAASMAASCESMRW